MLITRGVNERVFLTRRMSLMSSIMSISLSMCTTHGRKGLGVKDKTEAGYMYDTGSALKREEGREAFASYMCGQDIIYRHWLLSFLQQDEL